MNLERLYTAEAVFLDRYPGGFSHPDLVDIGKKHRVGKMAEQAQALLSEPSFANQAVVLDSIVKIVSRSSMVSLFEKPKFRDYVQGLRRSDRAHLVHGFRDLLHGEQDQGFDAVLDRAEAGDFVYFDPPYVPASATASFTSYTKHGFDISDQLRLADVARKLKEKGVSVILSNSDTPPVRKMYQRGFTRRQVMMTRAINSKASARGAVPELIIS